MNETNKNNARAAIKNENHLKITQMWLTTKSACPEGKVWVEENCKDLEAIPVIKQLAEQNWSWANWLIVNVMTRPQYFKYAIFSAEQVIEIYEKKYPENKKPRLSLESYTKENRAIDAITAALYASYAANAADTADRNKICKKILDYGISLLEGGKE